MGFEDLVKDIKKVYATLTSKDSEVVITYKGTSYGVTTPWNIKIDSREVNHASHEEGAALLFQTLKIELASKILFTEKQALELKRIMSSFSN